LARYGACYNLNTAKVETLKTGFYLAGFLREKEIFDGKR
jgi:hypothetical protein